MVIAEFQDVHPVLLPQMPPEPFDPELVGDIAPLPDDVTPEPDEFSCVEGGPNSVMTRRRSSPSAGSAQPLSYCSSLSSGLGAALHFAPERKYDRSSGRYAVSSKYREHQAMGIR